MALSPSDIIASNDFAHAKTEFLANTVETFQERIGFWPLVDGSTMVGKKTDTDLVLGPSGDAESHTPGSDLPAATLDDKERDISLEDEETVKNFRRTKIEDIVDHTDTRMKLSGLAGKAIRKTCEKHTLQMVCLGARVAASGDFPGGNQVEVAGADIETAFPMSLAGSRALQGVLRDWNQLAEESDVEMDEDDLFVGLTPYLYNVLLQDDRLTSRDYVGEAMADRIKRKILQVENFWILKSRLMPSTDLGAATSPTVKGSVVYAGDFSLTAFCGMKAGAIRARTTPMDAWFNWEGRTRDWDIGSGFVKGLAEGRPEFCFECVIDGV